MALSKQELKLRAEAKISELNGQSATLAADGTAEAQKRKEQLETSLKDAEARSMAAGEDHGPQDASL